jgi:cytochrome P450
VGILPGGENILTNKQRKEGTFMEISTQPSASQEEKVIPIPRREIKPNEEAISLNPFPWYQQMRTTQPVCYDKENEWWQVFDYENTQRILNDPATFSSEVAQRTMSEEERKRATEPSILSMDPPRHRQLRSLVTQVFTPRTVTKLAPRISAIINEHLDAVAEQGHMDVIADLAYPLPVIVIAEMLGVPGEDRGIFKHWSDRIVSANRAEALNAGNELRKYLQQITALRRAKPEDDLISALIAAQIDGQHLTEGELLSFYLLLLVAGNETTTNLIGNAFICFDEQPGVFDQLRADPSLIPGALEEVLRYRSPVQRVMRIVTSDTTLGGQHIKAGDIVLPWTGSANRDPAQFPNPDVFDIRRTPNRHVGFGHGIHFCVGAPLSRIEGKIAFEIILQRFQQIRIDHTTPLERIQAAAAFFGVQRLPVTFS